jgi:hypothetical protein
MPARLAPAALKSLPFPRFPPKARPSYRQKSIERVHGRPLAGEVSPAGVLCVLGLKVSNFGASALQE